MSSSRVVLVIPPGLPGTMPNREGASGLGAVSPIPRGAPRESVFRYPPHTVAVVAAALRGTGYDVAAIDAVALDYDIDRCVGEALALQPALIGVFVSWSTREADRLFLSSLRREGGLSAPVVAFGIGVGHMREYLRSADCFLEGEPEGAFPALCTRLLQDKELLPTEVTPASLGVAGYDARGLLTDLDALPYPAWDIFSLDRYPYLTILSSRGCEDSCTWCPYVVAQGRRFRVCSPARVVAELREVVRLYHPRRVVFRDPAFAHDRGRVESICRQIIADRLLRPGKALIWECESHPEHLDRGLLRLMSLAGCVGVKVGLETTDANVLAQERRIGQGDDAESYLAHVVSVTEECARLGIGCRVFVLAGLPGQTAAIARETAGFVRTLRPASLTVKVVEHYPGVALSSAQMLSKDGIDAQVSVLRQAQDAIAGQPVRRSARWRRALRRLFFRVSSVFTLGRS